MGPKILLVTPWSIDKFYLTLYFVREEKSYGISFIVVEIRDGIII